MVVALIVRRDIGGGSRDTGKHLTKGDGRCGVLAPSQLCSSANHPCPTRKPARIQRFRSLQQPPSLPHAQPPSSYLQLSKPTHINSSSPIPFPFFISPISINHAHSSSRTLTLTAFPFSSWNDNFACATGGTWFR